MVFELAGLPVPDDLAYRFYAEEVKQTAFRLDGVLRPEGGRDHLPLIFVETQFQRRTNFYARWLASIFLYLFRHPGITRTWRAVVVFPDRATDSGAIAPYEPLLDCGLVHRIYLADLLDDPAPGFGARLVRLVVMDPAAMVTEARALLAETGPDHRRANTLDLIETILVYKFPNLSRDEIRIMLHLPDTKLKQTRFYQEAFQEGKLEGELEGELKGKLEGKLEGELKGKLQGELSLVLRLLKRRLGSLTAEQQARIQTLPSESLESLGEALLDFQANRDLDAWLKAN